MKKHNHFQRGGRGVFTCIICDRRTRAGQSNIRFCPECWELARLEDSVLGGHQTITKVAPERDRQVDSAVERGGNGAKIRHEFIALWKGLPQVESTRPEVSKGG